MSYARDCIVNGAACVLHSTGPALPIFAVTSIKLKR